MKKSIGIQIGSLVTFRKNMIARNVPNIIGIIITKEECLTSPTEYQYNIKWFYDSGNPEPTNAMYYSKELKLIL